jgi:hypothetical protein
MIAPSCQLRLPRVGCGWRPGAACALQRRPGPSLSIRAPQLPARESRGAGKAGNEAGYQSWCGRRNGRTLAAVQLPAWHARTPRPTTPTGPNVVPRILLYTCVQTGARLWRHAYHTHLPGTRGSNHAVATMALCNACNVRLPTEDAVKTHYRTGWHALNLQRRVAELTPVSEADYDAHQNKLAEAAAAAAAEDVAVIYICDACRKKFASAEQMEAHNRSTRHRERVKELVAARKAVAAGAPAEGNSGEYGTATSSTATTEPAPATTVPRGAGESKQAPAEDAMASTDSHADGPIGPDEMVVTSSNCIFCFKASRDVERCVVCRLDACRA